MPVARTDKITNLTCVRKQKPSPKKSTRMSSTGKVVAGFATSAGNRAKDSRNPRPVFMSGDDSSSYPLVSPQRKRARREPQIMLAPSFRSRNLEDSLDLPTGSLTKHIAKKVDSQETKQALIKNASLTPPIAKHSPRLVSMIELRQTAIDHMKEEGNTLFDKLSSKALVANTEKDVSLRIQCREVDQTDGCIEFNRLDKESMRLNNHMNNSLYKVGSHNKEEMMEILTVDN